MASRKGPNRIEFGMTIQVYRLSASTYQDSSFFTKESELLNSIDGIRYINSMSELSDVEPYILLSNTHTNPQDIPEQILSHTIAIIHPNSGYDNFDIPFVEKANFPIILGNPIRSHPVAEYILGCLFQHFVSIPNQLHWNTMRKWDRSLLRDQNILILGQGTIGKILSSTLTNLTRRVVTYDPYKKEQLLKTKKITELSKENIEKQNVVIFTQSLNEENANKFDRSFFDSLRNDTLIINAARGGFIIEAELQRYLSNNPKAFAFLDVFQDEPYSPALFSKLSNINKTSHIAGVHSKLNDDILNFEYQIVSEIAKYKKENKLEQFTEDFKELSLKSKIEDGKFI